MFKSPIPLTPLCALTLLLAPPTLMAQEGWYAGDLHAHSLHSDGDSPVADIVAMAEAVGLDFFALTDHDSSMGGDTPHWSDPGYQSDSVTLLYGVEWTTGLGHANVWAAEPFDYRPLWSANLEQDPWAAAVAAHEAGALFSINHPTAYQCCPWDVDGDFVDAIEVWNGSHRVPTVDFAATRDFWGGVLAAGGRPTAVGGSDMHDLVFPLGVFYTVGEPTTWVYASENTPEGILEAIDAGRVSISYGPDAPRLELWADGDGDGAYETAMGETVEAGRVGLKVVLGRSGAERARGVKPLTAEGVRTLFEGDMGPSALAALNRVSEDAGCGLPFVVGLMKNDRLHRAARMDCGGGTWEVDVNADSGDVFRVEVLGLPQVDPIQHPVFGLYIAMSNPVYVNLN